MKFIPNPEILLRSTWIFSLLMVWGTGCSSGTGEIKRYPLSGEVTFDGQPVQSGNILLEPDSHQGNKGPASSALIQGGKYTIPTERGVVGGPYIVRLTGYGEAPKSSGADEDPGTPLFADHEVSLEIPEASSTQDFHITSRKN